ncbi:MAG: SDR family NAD(P)-dependent oxidoreductase [Ferruginibacter sp.]
MERKIACITGATSGIGKSCAALFAAHQYDLVVTGRRTDRLQALQEKLTTDYGVQVTILTLDVQDQNQVFEVIEKSFPKNSRLDVLVNNAGLSLGRQSIADGSLDDWNTMLNTNVHGLLYMTKALLPALIQAEGTIINIGSIAGLEAYENGNVYCASKAAVDMLTKTMRMDLLKHRVRVTAIHPGAVETAFSLVRYKGDQQKADAVYQGFVPLTPDDVAQTVYFAASQPAHVCINELIVMPTAQASASLFHKTS